MYKVVFVNGFNDGIECAMEWDNEERLTAKMFKIIASEAYFWTIYEKNPYLIYKMDENGNKRLLFGTIYADKGLILYSDYMRLYGFGQTGIQELRLITEKAYWHHDR